MQKNLLTVSNPPLKDRKTNEQHISDLTSQVCNYWWQSRAGFRPDIHSCLPERSSKEKSIQQKQ